jgi:lipopolysaccharide export LptBFGC system permease protein LptF
MISSKPQDSQKPSCSLFIENAKKKKTPTEYLYELSENKKWKVSPEIVSLSMVQAQRKELTRQVASEKYTGRKANKDLKKLSLFTTEPFRRLSLSFAVFTLALAGGISAIRLGRQKSIKQFLLPFFLFGFFLALYLAGKNLSDVPWAALLFYILPHPVLIYLFKKCKLHIEKGREW